MEKTSGVERYLGVLVKEFSSQTYLALFFIEHVTLTYFDHKSTLYIQSVCWRIYTIVYMSTEDKC